jgi:glycosyltransferase involved in cell wall biosynthesis
MPSLTVIIVAKNEAQNIADCVKSASFANEVIVLDSGSTDATADIARGLGARVMLTDWPGYGPQNNRGIDAATSDWVFSLDADERISPELAAEIRQAIASPTLNGFRVPRLSQFCGQFMHHGDWWPDYTRRLVRKGQGRFTEHFLHANLQISGELGTLKAHLIHYSYRNLEDVLEKLNRYSSGNARDYASRGKGGSLGSALAHGLWAFVRTYFVKRGFLDGKLGFVLAVYNAEVTYYKYLKLMFLQKN